MRAYVYLSMLRVPHSKMYGFDIHQGCTMYYSSRHISGLKGDHVIPTRACEQVVQIPGAGHNLMLDQPRLFAEAVCGLVLHTEDPPRE